MRVGRRRALALLAGSAGLGSLAGCGGSEDPAKANADVIAGPDGRLAFDPKTLTIDREETVTWFFDSGGHNVSGRPDDSPEVSLPEGAGPFASYDQGESPSSIVPPGETYEHTFSTPGTYVYVCIPHQERMIGHVRVRNR